MKMAGAIATVASAVGDGLMAFMPQVGSELSLQGFLDHNFGQLLEQAVLANEVFGLFVIGQQSAEQRFCTPSATRFNAACPICAR